MELNIIIADPDDGLVARCRQWCALKRIALQAVNAGVECIEKLRQSPPDVLALAVDLPWGGADGVLAVMEEESRLRSIPVILLTRDESVACPRVAFPENVVGRLTKPFQVTELLEIVCSAADYQDILQPFDGATTRIGTSRSASEGRKALHRLPGHNANVDFLYHGTSL